jgi:hypothetical protein
MKFNQCLRFACVVICGLAPVTSAIHRAALADDPPSIRSQAVVNFSFDEASGDALDSAMAGAAKDVGTLQNGAVRVKSPFWGQSGRQAVILNAPSRQFIQVADSPDVDRPDAVTLSLFFINLHPAADAGYHGIIAKRDESKQITNYGINYVNGSDTFQVYLNDTAGYKSANYSVSAAVGRRRPVFITVVYQVGDAPAPDADEDKDDVLIRFYANGQPVKPKGAAGGAVAGNDVWLTDVNLASQLNDAPLTLGASTPAAEFTSCLIDEVSIFGKALSNDEVAKLFVEVAGANAPALIADESKPVPGGPEISALSLNGLTRGQTTVLAISGSNLLPDPVLVPAAAIEKQVLRPGATPERIEFEVTIPATAPAGHIPLRVQTSRGISGAMTMAVDSLPQVAFAESAPDKPVSIPTAISGTLSGQQAARVYFAAKAGQHLVVDLECRRLGAAMDPVLELRNPRGAPLSIAWGRPQLQGDTRIETNLFADGAYSLELHDLAYKAPAQSVYRLKIGDLKLVDTTFPAAVVSGTRRSVAAIGPGMDPGATLAVDMQDQVAGVVTSLVLPVETGAVGPAPDIAASDDVELLEEAPADGKLQTIDAQFSEKAHVPVVVNGRIARHGETDRYLLNVKPGMTLILAVDSYGFHSPLEPQIVISSHPDGIRQAISEERAVLDYAVPAGVQAIQVAVHDLNHRGGADFVYRLRIAPAGHPDFALSVATDRLTLPRDSVAVLRLDAKRAGYDGPIALALQGAPELTVSPAEIPAGISKTFVVVSAKLPDGAPAAQVKAFHVVGTSVGLDPVVQRVALAPAESRLALIPETRANLIASVTGPSAVALELGELPLAWFRGADPEIPLSLKVNNPDLAGNAVRLELLTTETARTQVDPADPAKQRKIPIPQLHSLPEQTLASGETTGRLRVAVPLEVVEGQIDCVVRADFLPHAFSEKVLHSTYSRAFRLPVQDAVTVQLASNSLALVGNSQAKFGGAVKRAAGFTSAVDVALINLPAGYTAPKVTVAPDQERFEIVVSAPAVSAAADLPNIQFRITTSRGTLLRPDTPLPTKSTPAQ